MSDDRPTQTSVPASADEIMPDPTADPVLPGNYLLELIPVPVTDVEQAKQFYVAAGWHADVDVAPAEGVRIVQLTPPGSHCSILLSTGLNNVEMPPGSLRGLHLVVADIEAARDDLIARGVDVEPIQDLGGVFYAAFSDPDGNTWTLQHMPWRQ